MYRLRIKNHKYEPTWDGPYLITGFAGKQSYRIMDMHGKELKSTQHGSKLKRAYSKYGSPIHHAAEYTRVFSDKTNRYYIDTIEDVIKARTKKQPT